MRRTRQTVLFTVFLSVMSSTALSTEQTVGLLAFEEGEASLGYTFFSPMSSATSYIVDINGDVVHSWEHELIPGNSSYLLENGDILRTGNPETGTIGGGGEGGVVTQQHWNGEEVWSFEYNDDQHRLHHDIEPLPNGNVLMISWEYRSASAAVAAGRNPSSIPDGYLWPDVIIEVNPSAPSGPSIVWEWHAWDHLVQNFDSDQDNYYSDISEHPELININFTANPSADWLHLNAIDFNSELNQILVSCPRFKEVWIIDHSTTTAQAASHKGGNSGMGGDLLYRWGNPRAWDSGTYADQKLFVQHGANWIGSGLDAGGDILLFNKGVGRPGTDYSTIESLTPPLNKLGTYDMEADGSWGPDETTIVFEPEDPVDLFAEFLSGAQRLPNGNTLICDGPKGRFFEVTPVGETVWLYVNPIGPDGPLYQCDEVPTGGSGMQDNLLFRVLRYSPDYPAFKGRDLTPMGPLELYYGDYTSDNLVDVSDLLAIIAGWGDPYDVNNLLEVIALWGGACP